MEIKRETSFTKNVKCQDVYTESQADYVLPVSPGRNLSVVIEVAAMNNRQKKMGYNTAEEFNKRLMQSMGLE